MNLPIRGHRVPPLLALLVLLPMEAAAQRSAPRPGGGGPIESTARAGFPNFESGPVKPLMLSADGATLYALNTPDGRLEAYTTHDPALVLREAGSVFTGLEPVAMTFHPTDPTRLFVSNHVSDTVTVVDLETLLVEATIPVGDEPLGMVVADGKLFVACARASVTPPGPGGVDPNPIESHVVVVRSAEPPYAHLGNVAISGVRPRDLVVDAGVVYVIPQDSGNQTTLLNETEADLLGIDQLTTDRFNPFIAVNPVLVKGALNSGATAHGWHIPYAGRIVFDFEYPDLTPQLLDHDVIGIDPATLTTLPDPTTSVGTTLFDIERNPYTGELWVLASEALNRFRFEPRLQGVAVENRITVVEPGGDPTDVILLQAPDTPRPFAQPMDVVFGVEADPRAFVAALGSASIAVLSATDGSYVEEIPTGELPTGLALDEARGVLYVYCRGDHALRAYDVNGSARPLPILRPLGYDPEPPSVRSGRKHLYAADDLQGHGNGTMSCASCHVFGHGDGIGWDLGNPEGSFAYYYPEIMTGQNGFDGLVVSDFFTPIANPLKGPMVTQSLRGLLREPNGKDDRPLHWRGDRVLFQMFKPAFHGLLGGSGLDSRQVHEFATFLRSVRYAPNPHQPKDRLYRGEEDIGRDLFGMNEQFEGKEYVADSGLSCIVCHHGDFFDGSDYTGSRQTVSHGAFSQIFNTAQLRMVYEKDHRDVIGFGALHDGAFDGVRGFLDENDPRGGPPIFTNFTPEDKDRVAAFTRQWDHGLGPLVGAQLTIDDDNFLEGYSFLALAEPQARAGFETGVPHVDLILKGHRVAGAQNLRRGAVYFREEASGDWRWRFDTGDEVDTEVVLFLARAGLAVWTFTCVPPGLGERLGIDRDEDGLYDEQERLLGTDLSHPDTDRDGWSDAAEVRGGGDPLVDDDVVADFSPPGFLQAFVGEIGPDTATFTAVLDEAVRLRLRLGTAPGQGDLGRLWAEGRRCQHDLILTDLPADIDVYWTATVMDSGGNLSRANSSFRTFVPLFHVEDIQLDVTGTGPYSATARVLVHDHRGSPVADVPVRGLWDGDIGPQNWIQDFRSGADGWASFPLQDFTPTEATTLAFSPAYVGSGDPADPWFSGYGGERPNHFYDQAANKVHYVKQALQ